MQTKQVGDNANDVKQVQVTVINNQTQPIDRPTNSREREAPSQKMEQGSLKFDKIPAHMSKKQLNGNLFIHFYNKNFLTLFSSK